MRSKQNSTYFFNRGLLELEVNYDPRFHKAVKPIELNFGFRHIVHHKKEWKNYLRFHIDFLYKFTWERLHLDYRFRFQMIDDPQSQPYVYANYWVKDFRNLIQIGYNFKKWKLDPEIWAEIFYHDEIGALNGFTDFRIGIRTNYNLTKHHSLGIKYFTEQEIRYYKPETTHIFALFYKYQFKLKKKNK